MNLTDLGASPLIIIGAGRSGTNMLRDVLTRLDGMESWPCDEINYIWRHGNRTCGTDEFDVAMATPAVRRFIRDQFSRLVRKSALSGIQSERKYILEKTCANSLRVDFVDRVIPEARYIHLIRDGRDVVSSAMQRWKAPLDIGYLAAKARYVPATDIPYYAMRYLGNRLSKIRNPESRLAIWGPRFESMGTLAASSPLEVVCATQWSRCVEASLDSFASMPSERYLEIRYENFVSNPLEALMELESRFELGYSRTEFEQACSIVRTDSVGKGRRTSEPPVEEAISAMRDTLLKCGYQI